MLQRNKLTLTHHEHEEVQETFRTHHRSDHKQSIEVEEEHGLLLNALTADNEESRSRQQPANR